VQRLVAGGAPDLLPNDVAVVYVSRPAPAAAPAPSPLAHVGPIAVARSSSRPLAGTLAALVALVLGLAALTYSLYARLGRARAELASRAAGSEAP